MGIFDFFSKPYIMGIINITPDSFSDGGLFVDHNKAVDHAVRMAEEGADIIDIGGESTRPGAQPVTTEEEIKRVIPVIRALSREVNVALSIDTTKARVATEALAAGAEMVNDVSALRFDSGMVSVVAHSAVPVVLMHMRGSPRIMQHNTRYSNLMGEITAFLQERITFAQAGGIEKEKIIIDPGIGFGKSLEQGNFSILKNLADLKALGRPILVGPSRKAFLGHLLDLPIDDREDATAASVAVAIMNGANIVRVHDVKRMKRVVKVVDAIQKS